MKVITDAGVIEIGTTEAAPTIGLTDYSRRETDDFGVTTVVKRNFSRTMSTRVMVPTANVDALQRQLAALRAKPVQWVADDRFDSLAITGFYKDLSIDLAIPPVSYCTLTIEGLAEGADYADPGTDPATDQRKSTLRLLRPATIDDAVLTSSNVPENDYPAWSASATYALGARVILSATHRIYESAANGNVGNNPTGTAGQWIDIGPTNRWAMFDQALGSQTERAGSIVVSLDPVDPIDAVALLDVTAVSVRVQAPGYDRTLSPAIQPGAVTFLDLPATAGVVTITISGSGAVSAGTLLIGKLLGLGTTEASPTAAITDYSRKETDAFGEVTVVERAWAKRMDVKSLISTAAVDVVAARIANMRAMPALWIGDATLESLAIYGFFKDFSIAVDEHVSTLSLSIEGLSTAAKLAPLGADVSWSDIKDDDPAHPKPEDGATVGATPGTNIFFPELPDIPMPPGLLRNDYVKLRSDGRLVYQPYGDPAVEEELGRISLPDIGALSASEGRRLDEASDRLAAAVLQAITDSDKNRVTLRDAGVYVDPATGQVRISAIDATAERVSEAYIRLDALRGEIVQRATVSYVDGQLAKLVIDPSQFPVFEGIELRVYNAEQRISGAEASINSKASALEVNAQGARLTDAELDIDAIEGKIDLKVDSTEFNALGLRVATAEQALEAIGDTASITQVVSVSRRLRTDIGDANEQILRTLLAGDAARRGQLDAMAQARQEITAKINDDNAAEARARQQLVVKVGAVEASALVETNLRIEGDRAVAQQVTDLSTAIGDQMAGFDERIITIVDDQDLISAGLTQTISAVRGVSGDADAAVEAALRGLLTGDKSGRDTASAIAAAREELTVKINQDAEAILQRVSALLVRMGGAEASILSMELLRATAELAIVARLNSLTASIGDNKAAIEREEIARTDAVSAQAGRIDTIVSRIGADGAADAIEAKIEEAATTYVTDLEALAGRTETVESRIGAEGSEDSIEAKIAEAATTYAGPLEAQAEKIESVESRLGVEGTPGSIEAAIETASKTYVTDLEALAGRTETVESRIGAEGDPDSIEAKIEEAALTYAGPLEAQAERIDTVNARLGVEGQPGSIEAKIETASKTYVTDLQAQSERTDTIVARIGVEGDPDSIEAKIEDTREVLADVEGKLTSRVRIAATAGDTVYMELVADQHQGSRIVFGGDVFGDGIFTAKHFVSNALIVPAYVYMNGPVNGPGWDSGDTGPGGVGGGTGGGGGSGGVQIP